MGEWGRCMRVHFGLSVAAAAAAALINGNLNDNIFHLVINFSH